MKKRTAATKARKAGPKRHRKSGSLFRGSLIRAGAVSPSHERRIREAAAKARLVGASPTLETLFITFR